jgi:hypothetical protein|tara:strand:+ start:136 stop:591 length:456 start_codon:yes stop_codon:yes gene_type:complete
MQDTLKTLSISLCSSICTALFVVACTAAADKSDTSSDGYPEYEDEEGGSTGGGSGGGVDGGGDDDADDMDSITEALAQIAELGTTVAAQQAAIVELEQFKSNSLCFIGHMTDDMYLSDDEWREISNMYEATTWEQGSGSGSDAMRAYEDCF